MKVLITGGGGFLGTRLAEALRSRHPAARIRLLDMAFPPGHSERFECVQGDGSSPAVEIMCVAAI